jgi:hypothetical protein
MKSSIWTWWDARGAVMTVKGITLRVDLTPGEAAGLKRLADKTGWSEAMAVLYPHVHKEVRGDQAREILRALAHIHEALQTMNVSSFPWINCGRAGFE